MQNQRVSIMADLERVYHYFYRVVRCGANTLSDGGGPFGFDIQAALMVNHLILAHECDIIFETGCHFGDTTAFLADLYPDRKIITCDNNVECAQFTAARLRNKSNVEIFHADSRALLARNISRASCPFLYLDAHWDASDWPLEAELHAVQKGVVCIDDFNIGDSHFAFDHYNGKECGPNLLALYADRFPRYYVPRPTASFPFPCLQTRRRGGKAFIEVGQDFDAMAECQWFEPRDNFQQH
jgi:hypothetical protein